MEELTCRLLPYTAADGPTNMATDEVLLLAAASGVATLRFYGWSTPTLSLGYFQSAKVRLANPLLATMPVVRRASGGETLVHDHELTYALALPPGPWQRGQPWPLRMHEIIASALAQFGLDARLFAAGELPALAGPLCFHHFTPGDLMIGSAKVVGSAQRKHKGAILQHGGILLARSAFAPTLEGIAELTGRVLGADELQRAIVDCFAFVSGARLEAGLLTAEEEVQIADLRLRKYGGRAWNYKR